MSDAKSVKIRVNSVRMFAIQGKTTLFNLQKQFLDGKAGWNNGNLSPKIKS